MLGQAAAFRCVTPACRCPAPLQVCGAATGCRPGAAAPRPAAAGSAAAAARRRAKRQQQFRGCKHQCTRGSSCAAAAACPAGAAGSAACPAAAEAAGAHVGPPSGAEHTGKPLHSAAGLHGAPPFSPCHSPYSTLAAMSRCFGLCAGAAAHVCGTGRARMVLPAGALSGWRGRGWAGVALPASGAEQAAGSALCHTGGLHEAVAILP